MTFFTENDSITRLVKVRAALADEAPLMNWEEFFAKNGHHLPGKPAAMGFGPTLILGLVITLNGVLLALSLPIFLQKWEDIPESAREAKAVFKGVATGLEVSPVPAHVAPIAGMGEAGLEADDALTFVGEKRSLPRTKKNAGNGPVMDAEMLSQKINQYFEQLKSDNPSQVAEKYLRSLLKAKDSLDRAFQGVYDAELEFGVVKSGERHYAEYLAPQDFVRLSKEKMAVVLDLRKPQDFEQVRLRHAVSAEYNLRYLQQVSEEIPRNKAIFLYGDDLKECESAKAFFWKKGFQTVYILNKPFNPDLFRKSDLVTSTR
jgi:rhodanese-related sulfurtransferase